MTTNTDHTAGLTARIDRITVTTTPDHDPDLSWLEQDYDDPSIPPAEAAKYREQDAKRLATYGDDWYMLGVIASAHVIYDTPQGGWITGPVIESPGLWGVESDRDPAYLDEIAGEQVAELAPMLAALGFTPEQIADAIADADTKPAGVV